VPEDDAEGQLEIKSERRGDNYRERKGSNRMPGARRLAAGTTVWIVRCERLQGAGAAAEILNYRTLRVLQGNAVVDTDSK